MEAQQKVFFSAKQLRRSYPSAFEESWTAYPRRDGPTSKQDAFRQWQRRLLAGYEAVTIHEGVLRYKAHCDRTGKTETSFVMQAERFFGQGLHFLNEYAPPPSPLAAHRRIWKPPTERADVPAGYLTALLHEQITGRCRRQN